MHVLFLTGLRKMISLDDKIHHDSFQESITLFFFIYKQKNKA